MPISEMGLFSGSGGVAVKGLILFARCVNTFNGQILGSLCARRACAL